MEERRGEGLSAQDIFDAGAGFVVAGHNYGRLDRLSVGEIGSITENVARMAEELAKLQEGLRIAKERRLEAMTLEMKSKYEC